MEEQLGIPTKYLSKAVVLPTHFIYSRYATRLAYFNSIPEPPPHFTWETWPILWDGFVFLMHGAQSFVCFRWRDGWLYSLACSEAIALNLKLLYVAFQGGMSILHHSGSGIGQKSARVLVGSQE